MRGTVAMKIDDKTAHVCLGNNDVALGDEVVFYANKCNPSSISDKDKIDYVKCNMEEIGYGEVTKILNSHYSEVKTQGNFKMTEGTLVQKKKI